MTAPRPDVADPLSIPADIAAERDWSTRLRAVLADGLAVSERAGFARPTWDAVPTKLALALTEVREAYGAARADNTEPAAWTTELLDYAIRVGGVLAALWPGYAVRTTRDAVDGAASRRAALYQSIHVTLWPLIEPACDAIQSWRSGAARGGARCQIACEQALAASLVAYASAAGRGAESVVADIATVVDRNRRRPRLHGHHEVAG